MCLLCCRTGHDCEGSRRPLSCDRSRFEDGHLARVREQSNPAEVASDEDIRHILVKESQSQSYVSGDLNSLKVLLDS